MRTQVRKIGNSLGNIIPAAFIKQLGLVEGADIEVEIELRNFGIDTDTAFDFDVFYEITSEGITVTERFSGSILLRVKMGFLNLRLFLA